MTGRRIGYLQMGLAVVGVMWTGLTLAELFRQWISYQRAPQAIRPWLYSAAGGMVVFFAAWLWSVLISIGCLRQAKKS